MSKMRLLIVSMLAAMTTMTTPVEGQKTTRYNGPIIDMHLHAYLPQAYPQTANQVTGKPPVSKTSEEHMQATLDAMNEHNIVLGLVSGPLEAVQAWREFAPERFVGGAMFGRAGEVSINELRARLKDGRMGLLGEITAQYEGLSPSDPQFEPYFDLAEELDIPVGIHTGSSAPGTPITGHPSGGVSPKFRLRYGNPLLLEDMLVRHSNLRVFMMHMGDPWLTETLAMLWMYPDLYLDLSVKNWVLPKEVFHRYLKALVDAGYSKRLMFGSDQMIWPETIGLAIEGIESADFLTAEQKADIFYNNAARFLRLSEEDIARHHGR
jgi:predicted TIM-barrel fold metal-dependent hydrolase